MWNISYAYPTLFILIFLMVFYFSLPRIPIRRNRVYVNLLLIETLCIATDIISSWVDNNYPQISPSALYIINGIYFITFFIRSCVIYSFNEAVLSVNTKDNKLIYFLTRLPLFLGIICVIINPIYKWIYYVDETGYNDGSLYGIVYIIAFFYCFISFSIFAAFRLRLRRRRYRYCLWLCNMLILSGLILRLCFPKFLLMHTFCLGAILSLSVAFEDPEIHLELHGMVFNGKALRDYVEERYGKLEHRVIGITLFKYYDMRDVYGTTQMDACLNMVGRYLTQTFKKCLIFYYRKGRFVILGPKDMDIEAAEKEIESRFKSTWRTEQADIYLNIGLRSMELEDYEYSSDTILSTLVRALNEAGEKGGILKAEAARDEFEKTERETEIKRCLENAIDKDNVEIFLQPIMDSKSGKPVGAEVLSRIRDAEGQIIPPASFISIAEKSGRIVELGEQILEKTCRFMKEWEPEKMGFKWINVNLSPVQLMRQDLADRFEAMVYKYDVNPDLIHLEITEETLIDAEFMTRQTGALCDKGFNLVLDDYGTGYSNLSRLKRLPFINIKLDKSLVWDYTRNSGLIIPNMINSFKNMGFSITAEGIEDEVMADKMREAGCDFLQGFLYSKPISVDEFIEKYS